MCLYVTACHLVRHNYSREANCFLFFFFFFQKMFIIDYVQIPEVKLLYWLKTPFRDLDVR